MRKNDRAVDALRPFTLQRGFTRLAPGSVLASAGGTRILCTVSVEETVPDWLKAKNPTAGWLTAEYNMLPGSTRPRKARERSGKLDGRTSEIQRLIGRSLRTVVDLSAVGPRTLAIDCDVLEADGGTRTTSVTGAFVALVDALSTLSNLERHPLRDSVAAVSVGVVSRNGVPTPMLDLDYSEDSGAAVDMNVVGTGSGEFVEVQGTGERTTFSETQLFELLRLAKIGLAQLKQAQRDALGSAWPFP